MGLADRMEDVPGDFDALDFTWGVDCGRTAASEWCFYREPHEHGFACDKTCPCKTDQARWRYGTGSTAPCPVCNWTGPSPQYDIDGNAVHHPTHEPSEREPEG